MPFGIGTRGRGGKSDNATLVDEMLFGVKKKKKTKEQEAAEKKKKKKKEEE